MLASPERESTVSEEHAPKIELNEVQYLELTDKAALEKANKDYGDSWRRRGGVGAFMMLARKWDRIETQLKNNPPQWDVLQQLEIDDRPEGLIDDIRDLRRYLMLVEAHHLRNSRNG